MCARGGPTLIVIGRVKAASRVFGPRTARSRDRLNGRPRLAAQIAQLRDWGRARIDPVRAQASGQALNAQGKAQANAWAATGLTRVRGRNHARRPGRSQGPPRDRRRPNPAAPSAASMPEGRLRRRSAIAVGKA